MQEPDYIQLNKQSWNANVPVHMASPFYGLDQFIKGQSSLNDIELQLLGNIEGKSILHLQCHFGQDSISLARLGAKVTGVDFSEQAIEAARNLAQQTGANADFICCDVYSLPEYLDHHFDIVFTSYGVIGWLPDMEKWAYVVSKFLKPGGSFVMVEFHPVVWMFDNDFDRVEYRYFNAEPIVETTEGSYADRSADIKNQTVNWNHSLDEVISNLIEQGLQIESFKEYDYSPYNCFNHTVETSPGHFQIKKLGNKIPMLYSIKATKNANSKKSSARGV